MIKRWASGKITGSLEEDMIEFGDTLSFSLDALPLSLNNLYPNGSHGKRFKTPKAKELLQLIALQTRGVHLDGEAFSLSLLFHFPDRRRHDSSNYCKHIEDCLVELGVIADDNLITEHILRKTAGPARTDVVLVKLA